MRYFKKSCLVLMLCIMTITFTSHESYAWRWPFRRRKPVNKGRITKPGPPPQVYKFIKSHDLNNNGKFDERDRLMWLKMHRKGFTTVIINDDNMDIYEIMDYDNDGKVTKAEMDKFCATYDLNENGVLEESEIEAVTRIR